MICEYNEKFVIKIYEYIHVLSQRILFGQKKTEPKKNMPEITQKNNHNLFRGM